MQAGHSLVLALDRALAPGAQPGSHLALPWAGTGIVAPPPLPVPRSAAVEFEARVSPAGDPIIVAGRQHLTVKQGLAGRTLTVWADLHSIHLLLDGHVTVNGKSTRSAPWVVADRRVAGSADA